MVEARTRKKIVVGAGYFGLGVLSFAYFLFAGFPFDRLVQSRLADIEKQAAVKIDMATLKAGWMFSLVATDVRITPAARRGIPTASATEPQEPALRLERVKVALAPLSLLSARIGARIDAQAYGGRISGTVASGRGKTIVDLAVSNVEIAKYTPLTSRYQLNVAGQVGGTVDLVVDAEDAAKSTGKIDLQVKNPIINESNPYNIQKIPSTGFEKGGAAVIELKDGKALLKDVGLHGSDLDVTLDGEIQLRKKLNSSTWSARATIKMSEGFRSALPLIETFLLPGKATEGEYRYRLSGLLGSPRPAPDRSPR